MATDSTLPVRRAILTLLKDDASLTALVPVGNVYPQAAREPAWPFLLCGAPSSTSIRATCVDGAEITVAIHGFVRERIVGGATVETAEDHASRIGAAIAKALDGKRPTLPSGYAIIRWTGSQLLIDSGEADAFHTVQNFRVRCIT